MSRSSCPIKLVHGSTGQLIDATLLEGLSKKNLDDHELNWIPHLKAANEATRNKGGRLPVAEDAHWRWNQKMDATAGQLAYRHYAIEHENSTEGLMMIAPVGHQSRIHVHKDIVYIDYLSVAPQNRLVIQNPPKFKAVGSILFNYSIQVSMAEG